MLVLLRRITPVAALLLPLACGSDSNTNNTSTNNTSGLCYDVSGSEDVDGLSIKRPQAEVQGCRGIDGEAEDERVCEEVTPDLSCVGQSEALGTPIMVTFAGCVNSFGLDAQSDDLTVTVLKETVGGATTDPGYDLAGAPDAQSEKTPAAFVGKTRSSTAAKTLCINGGKFALAEVPTETHLIVRVTDQHVEKADRAYIDTYQYNVLLRNDQLHEGPTADTPLVTDPATYCASNRCYAIDDVNTVFETTFKTVALTAGVSRIEGDDDLYDGSGQGHIAGEIQDCSSENTVRNAVVGIDAEVKKLAYFNVAYPPAIGNLEDPKVDQSRSRTNADGLYAAIAVDTQDGGQPVKIGALATLSLCGDDGICQCKDDKVNPDWPGADTNEARTDVLGSRTIYVYPDSITILTFDRNLYTLE